jgi:hypothetical protein
VYAGSIPTLASNKTAAKVIAVVLRDARPASMRTDTLMTIGGGRAILARTK